MHGNVSFIELGSVDADISRRFFERIFGWSFNHMPQGGGWFQTPTIRVGLHGQEPQPQIYLFFEVPDLDQAIALVRASGGEADALGPEQEGFGQFAQCRDPQGIRFGLHQVPRP